MSSASFSYLLNKKRMPENKIINKADDESKKIDKLARSLDQVSNVMFTVTSKISSISRLVNDLMMHSNKSLSVDQEDEMFGRYWTWHREFPRHQCWCG